MDLDSYSLYCSMLINEYERQGTASNNADPTMIEACRNYVVQNIEIGNKTNKEIYV